MRWSFASRYPWLEPAFARAYADNAFPGLPGEPPPIPGPSPAAPVSPPNGALPPAQANNVAAQYLSSVQAFAEPVGELDEWVKLDENQWEHASWLDGPRVERVMDVLLERNWIEQRPDKPADDQIAAIVAQSGRFVAICEPDGRFRSLIDRDALVQEVAKRA